MRDEVEFERWFFLGMAIVMAMIVLFGFGLHATRYNFDVEGLPDSVKTHAFGFLAWVVLYVAQNSLIVGRSFQLHMWLGIVGLGLAGCISISGLQTTFDSIRFDRVPPAFPPSVLLVLNGLTIVTFAGLIAAAALLRANPAWHKRLMFGGMLVLLSPAFGRILPLPVLQTWGGFGVAACLFALLFMAMAFDIYRRRGVHPAYVVIAVIVLLTPVAVSALAFSPISLDVVHTLIRNR